MSGEGRPEVRWQQAAPPSEAPPGTPPLVPQPPPSAPPARRRNWLPLAIAGVLALCLLCVGLVALGYLLRGRSPAVATIMANVRPAATAPAGQGVGGLATATSAPAGASPAARTASGGQLVTSGACRTALPDGFAEEQAGGGYYPATDRSGFAALDWPDAPSVSRALPLVRANLGRLLADFEQTGLDEQPNSARLTFRGTAEGRPGKGTVHLAALGRSICVATLYLVDGSAIPYEPALTTLVSSLEAIDPPPPRPTPTPTPRPTPRPTP